MLPSVARRSHFVSFAVLALLLTASCQRGGAPDEEPAPEAVESAEGADAVAADAEQALAAESGEMLGASRAWASCGGDCRRVGFDLLSRGETSLAVPALATACAAGDLAACSGFDMHAEELCATPEAVAKLSSELRCPDEPLHCFIRSEIALHCEGNFGEALTLAESGCSFDDMPSCQQIGEFQMTTLNEPESGVRRFMIACRNGYAQGCFRSGVGALENPLLFRHSREEAVDLIGTACELGLMPACLRLRVVREGR
ncbi:MAG: hypothetical protein ACI81R_002550 [Bradymonadia bacterium]|jgi:hypothetical protein